MAAIQPLEKQRIETTIKGMGRKRKTDGHATPRQPVQIPVPWVKLTRSLAAKQKQPLLWYLLSLVADAAEAADMEHPPLPWEESAE